MIYNGRFEINPATLHVERVNAKAMVEGFEKNGKRHYLSILTAHSRANSLVRNFREIPKLITNHDQKFPKKIYPMSEIGKELNSEKYNIEQKYVAILDTIYPIENKLSLWKKICTSGIFDIWKPDAPFESVLYTNRPQIMLIRVCEIYQKLNTERNTDRYRHVLNPEEVTIKRFIINNNEFESIRDKLELIIEDEVGKNFENRICTETSKIKI